MNVVHNVKCLRDIHEDCSYKQALVQSCVPHVVTCSRVVDVEWADQIQTDRKTEDHVTGGMSSFGL